jgi:hypothetical protein
MVPVNELVARLVRCVEQCQPDSVKIETFPISCNHDRFPVIPVSSDRKLILVDQHKRPAFAAYCLEAVGQIEGRVQRHRVGQIHVANET